MNGIDCTAKINARSAAALRAAGFEFAGRYLVPPRGNLAWKALVREELEALTAEGMLCLAVFETSARRPEGGYGAGMQDAETALARARELGIPRGACLYFAADYDVQPSGMQTVQQYLAGCRCVLGDEYRLGVYGGYRLIEAMAAAGAADCYWQTLAWSYGRISRHMHVYQHQIEVTVTGIHADLNECADPQAAGLFNLDSKEDDYMTRDQILAELGDQYIERFDQLPAWAQPVMRELLDAGIINGGTDAATDPDDINMLLSDIKTVIVNYRMQHA